MDGGQSSNKRPQGESRTVRTESVLQAEDPATGRTYYYNKYTMKTGWDAGSVSRRAVDREYGIGASNSSTSTADDDDAIADIEHMANPMFGRGGQRTVRTLTVTESKECAV